MSDDRPLWESAPIIAPPAAPVFAPRQNGWPGAQPDHGEKTPEQLRQERRNIIPAWLVNLQLDNDDLAAGIVPKNGIGLIVGRYGTGKSFFALDMASIFSSGGNWFGRDVPQVGVLYIAAEAGGTFDRRIVAHHFKQGVHSLGFIFTAIDFGREMSMEVGELIGRIQQANAMNTLGAPIKLIFVDTLARSGLKNENDSEAMNALIGNCDMIREMTGAIVVGIHHAGWAENRSRGHSSLPAAVDFEITINAENDLHTAEITKARDGVTGEKMSFVLETVTIGEDRNGHEITTCVVKPVEAAPDRPRSEKPKGTIAEAMLRELCNMACNDAYRKPIQMADGVPPGTYGVTKEAFKQRVLHVGIIDRDGTNPHAQFSQTVSKMVSKQVIRIAGDFVWPVSQVSGG